MKTRNVGASAAPRVLLTDTTRWAISVRVALGLSQAGCEVFAVCPSRHPLMKSGVVRQVFPYRGILPLGSVLRAIRSCDPALIIPCDDRGVQHLHELHQHAQQSKRGARGLASLLERSLGAADSFPVVASRYELLEIARQEGVRVPRTFAIRSARELPELAGSQPFPWVLKADGTWGGGGVKIVDSVVQGEQALEELRRTFRLKRVVKRWLVNRDSFWLRPWWNDVKPPIVFQAHVNGRPANCAALCWEGQILAVICVEVVSADGLTGPANVVRVVQSQEMTGAAERLARRLRLSGFFGLDFMIDDQTGEAYLIEMNPRATPLCHFRLGKRRDMVGALTARLRGQSAADAPPVTERECIAYFPQAWATQTQNLESCFQDIPEAEPELLQELLRPWPDRSLLFRAINSLQRLKSLVCGRQRANAGERPGLDPGPIVFSTYKREGHREARPTYQETE